MRCKCCDTDNAEWVLDDWYCSDCSFVIYDTINDYFWEDAEEEHKDDTKSRTLPAQKKA